MWIYKFLLMCVLTVFFASNLSAQFSDRSEETEQLKKNIDNAKSAIKKASRDVDIYLQYLSFGDSIIAIQEKMITERNDSISALNERLKKFEIDEFLSITDSAIFTSGFINLSQDEISHLPPRIKQDYILIKKIHDLNHCLANFDPLTMTIREYLKEAEKRIDEINAMDRKWLNQTQKDYYVSLVEKYYDIDERNQPNNP